MKFSTPLIPGKFIKRYKRFLVDVELENGEIVTAHCPNTGSMKTCLAPDWPVMLSPNDNPKRKLKYTLEMAHNTKCWIGLNTILANKIVIEGIKNGSIHELTGYETIQPEKKISPESRLDVYLTNNSEECFVEIKNVTLSEDNTFKFPDAVTKRGQKHLLELQKLKKLGKRAVIFYLIQRSDGNCFSPAIEIDPEYAKILKEVASQGVEVLAYQAEVLPTGIKIDKRIKARII
jgi:sugar fermentation stimulation protein A